MQARLPRGASMKEGVRVPDSMRRHWLVIALASAASALVLLLAVAWLKGGPQELRTIVEPIPAPGARP